MNDTFNLKDGEDLKHNKPISQNISGDIHELLEIFEAVRSLPLPPPLGSPVKTIGRKKFNRFLIISLIIFGLKREWSFRKIQEYARDNWDILKDLSFGIKKEPDHSTIYLVASKLRAVDVFRYFAKLKELRGESPTFWL